MKKTSLIFGAFIMVSSLASAQDYPTNAEPGKCYAKCAIPDKYETVTEQVLVRPASTKSVQVPATFQTVSEQVLVKQAGSRITVSPATYTTQEEQVLV